MLSEGHRGDTRMILMQYSRDTWVILRRVPQLKWKIWSLRRGIRNGVRNACAMDFERAGGEVRSDSLDWNGFSRVGLQRSYIQTERQREMEAEPKAWWRRTLSVCRGGCRFWAAMTSCACLNVQHWDSRRIAPSVAHATHSLRKQPSPLFFPPPRPFPALLLHDIGYLLIGSAAAFRRVDLRCNGLMERALVRLLRTHALRAFRCALVQVGASVGERISFSAVFVSGR